MFRYVWMTRFSLFLATVACAQASMHFRYPSARESAFSDRQSSWKRAGPPLRSVRSYAAGCRFGSDSLPSLRFGLEKMPRVQGIKGQG